ncbi:MAG: HEAT repeat domain-containing protein, partial [Myxococcota bacterium]|nr:HEAT repeat domain-containing protein [Myxococcota bacterium]
DPDDDVRLAAADVAIRLHAPGATDAVVGWLNAPDVRLRRKACDVARALPSARAVAPLARSLGDPDSEVRSAAAESLGHQSSADAVPPLLGRLDDPTPAVRVHIVAALARLGDARAVVPLVGKVQDSSPDVREAVVRALGDLGDLRASSALVLALRDQSDDVRRDALAALGRLGAADAVDAIAPFVADHSSSLRAAAFGALGHIASTEAVRVLVGALGTGDDATSSLERTAVRDALVGARLAAIPQLRALLAGAPSPQEATSAAWVLGDLRAHNEAPTIISALRRGTLPAAAALRALAGAGTASEMPVVLEFLADPSPIIRREALAAAAALLDPSRPDGRAVEPLAAVLRDARASSQERARIATLLGRTGAPRATPLLVDLVRAPDIALRIATIDALGVLGPNGADDALVDALRSSDTTVRLHAAVALAEAGGMRAREALLAQLDGGDEIDRAAVLTALGGVLARVPSETAIARLSEALDLAAGPERDAILEAIGRASLPSALRALVAVAQGRDPADRQTAATLFAVHLGDPLVITAARGLLADTEPSVRAQAAWSLGSIGDASDIARLEPLARGSETDPAVNATAAIGRIAVRARSADAATPALCARVSDARSYVRANALAGLALTGTRCGDGSIERTVLADDANEDARAAAALAISRKPDDTDRRALDRCAHGDPSGNVATRCRARAEVPTRVHASLVYVVAEGVNTPRAHGAYAMLVADGMVHVGMTDRRGATFDPVALEGEVALRPPSALAR